MEVREKLGDYLNRVALRHDEFIIERKGKPLAAMVPVEKLEAFELLARKRLLEMLDRQRGSQLSEKEADKLANEAKHWSRGKRRS
jgi:prevent-host-death family protein